MSFDMFEIGCFLELWIIPIEVLYPLVNPWVSITDGAVGTLKVYVVDGIEANNRSIQTNVGLCQFSSDEKLVRRIGLVVFFKNGFDFIQGLE